MRRSTVTAAVSLLLAAAGCSAIGKEFILHEFDSATISGIRPSSRPTILNGELSADHIRAEPEFVVRTGEFSFISDLLAKLNLEQPAIVCPSNPEVNWVIDFNGSGKPTTVAGNESVALLGDGTCRPLDNFSIGRALQ